MRQWVLKITEYADRMLTDLDTLQWPEHIKEAQRNWIGRSEGAEIDFKLSTGDSVTVFTTRPDTLYGATFLVLAPEHPLIGSIASSVTNHEALRGYVESAKGKEEKDRLDATKEKTGVQLEGVTATNPANGEEIPVFVADYVLGGYGTGAVMAVPAHDERDFEFATKFGMQIVPVIKAASSSEAVTTQAGEMMNSGEFSGMDSEEAKVKIVEKVGGRMTSTYRLKDWVFSRQRYWGEPIPVVHCEQCGVVAVPDAELPVRLPEVENYAPTGTGESPLADIADWVNTTCPKCAGAAKRETNTMPQWAGSSWYYLRFADPKNSSALIDSEIEKKWLPVDVYVGGDHAVRHLIYARFWHKFLYDIGVVHTLEPFTRLEFLGFILAEDGRKMSKRWGNIINPSDIVKTNGADALRVYEMFMGPFENTIAWSKDGIVGSQRFLERVNGLSSHVAEAEAEGVTRQLHKTIKKVTTDIEAFKFNTAISSMMIFINVAEKDGLTKESYQTFLKLLAPFAPHLTEELWSEAGYTDSIHTQVFPEADARLTEDDTVNLAVQINGKMRGTVSVSIAEAEERVLELISADAQLSKHLVGEISKVIYVPKKIINIIIKNS